MQPLGTLFARRGIGNKTGVVSFSCLYRFGVHGFEFGIVLVFADFFLCGIIIFQNVEHVVKAEHPAVRKHAVFVVNTLAVHAFRSMRFRSVRVIVFRADRHQIFCIPNVNHFAGFGGFLLVPIVRISLAVDDKLSVDRFESDDLIVFGALSVIVRIFTVAAYAISAVENLFEIAVALNIVVFVNVESIKSVLALDKADVDALVAFVVDDGIVRDGFVGDVARNTALVRAFHFDVIDVFHQIHLRDKVERIVFLQCVGRNRAIIGKLRLIIVDHNARALVLRLNLGDFIVQHGV